MNIGSKIGFRMGSQIGLVGDAAFAAMAGVTRDVASQIYCPADAEEWDAALAVAGIASGGPSRLLLCQDPGPNLADSIGSFTGTVAGTPIAYQQPVAGMTRLGVAGADAGTGVIDNTAAGLPDPLTTSSLMISYIFPASTPAAIRNFQVLGTGVITTTRINTTPRFQGLSGANTLTGAAAITGAVRLMIMQLDRTNSVVRCATDLELLLPAIAATAGKRHRLSLGYAGALTYHAEFHGAAAELTEAQLRTLCETLGWDVIW